MYHNNTTQVMDKPVHMWYNAYTQFTFTTREFIMFTTDHIVGTIAEAIIFGLLYALTTWFRDRKHAAAMARVSKKVDALARSARDICQSLAFWSNGQVVVKGNTVMLVGTHEQTTKLLDRLQLVQYPGTSLWMVTWATSLVIIPDSHGQVCFTRDEALQLARELVGRHRQLPTSQTHFWSFTGGESLPLTGSDVLVLYAYGEGGQHLAHTAAVTVTAPDPSLDQFILSSRIWEPGIDQSASTHTTYASEAMLRERLQGELEELTREATLREQLPTAANTSAQAATA
jgi:hypothetical protein